MPGSELKQATGFELASMTWQATVLTSYTTPASGTPGVPGSISPIVLNCIADYSAVTDRGLEPAATRLKAS